MEKLVEEILSELKQQKEALSRIEKQLHDNKLRKPSFSYSSLSLSGSAISFQELKDNLKKYCVISVSDIYFTKQKKYPMGLAAIIFKLFSQFEESVKPIHVVNKKVFLLKVNDTWSYDQSANIILFDEFVARIILHFLQSVYQIQVEGYMQPEDSTKIINQILTVKKETNFSKNVRTRFLAMYFE
jgi:hypothetical protein